MRIDIKEGTGIQSDIFLMDGDKIVEYKTPLDTHLVRDWVINVTNRYCLSKETVVRVNKTKMTLDEYVRSM